MNLPKNIVIGAGLWGCTVAERIATVIKEPVLVIDKREHIGGNCFSKIDPETGIEYHVYGSHIFHTSLDHVWKYINQFSNFSKFNLCMYSMHKGRAYNFPTNLKTINDFYSLNLKPYEVEAFIDKERGKEFIGEARNYEEKAISLIGRPLYEAFMKGYTQKQWQKDPRELPSFIIDRLPIRYNYETGSFRDTYQGLPLEGYFKLFENMTSNPLIEVMLKTSWEDIKDQVTKDTKIFYSGPIDAYFNYKAGILEYRSLRFEKEIREVQDYQGVSVMAYPDLEIPYTRIHEFKHLHPEREEVMRSKKTLLYYEYPTVGSVKNDFYYPVNTKENQKIFNEYEKMAKEIPNTIIAGRLGSYRYFDMDKVIDNALTSFNNYLNSLKN